MSVDVDPTEGVVVMRSHLEEWEYILRNVSGHLAATDLADNYRQMRPNLQPSKLTRLIQKTHERIEAYLDDVVSEG